MRHILILLTLLLPGTLLFGQTFNIANGGTNSSCTGSVTDSDAAGGNYLPNENHTMTICSDGNGNVINLNFATGLLNLGPGDTLFIYDGSSVNDPLITYFTSTSISLQISSTTANLTGCLTLHFTSDGSVEGAGFSANISCSDLCQPINPQIVSTPALVSYAQDSNYIYACPGDSIILSASGLFPHSALSTNHYTQSDATSTFEWNMGDGTSLMGQNITHIYTDEQGYFVDLTVTDVNGCQEIYSMKILHSITPVFNGIYADPDSICFQDTVELIGGFNSISSQAIGFSQDSGHIEVGGVVTGQTYLPDGSGAQYSTSINITGFPGQTIANGSDIEELYIQIEHSYLGDLECMLTCPNGTSVAIFDSYGPGGMLPNGFGGGGTFLGEAFDNNIGSPGVCWEYKFYDAAPNLAWALGYTTVPVFNPPSPSNGNSVAPGDYQPEQAFTNLVGCPINGNWTITIQDNLGIDDGYICEWGIKMDASISPNAESYLPLLINGYWETDPSIYASTDSNAFAAPTTIGHQSYTFYVEDDFGCIFDTTVHPFMLPEINPYIGADTTICPQTNLDLSTVVDLTTTPSCLYQLSMFDSGGDGWDGAKVQILLNGTAIDGSPFALTSGSFDFITFAASTGDAVTLTFIGGGSNNEISYQLLNSGSTIVYSSPALSNGTTWTGNLTCTANLNYVYNWTPGANLNNTTIPDPVFSGSNDEVLILEIDYLNSSGCAEYDTVEITIEQFPMPQITGDLAVCIGESTTLSVLNGLSYDWSTGDTTQSITIAPLADTAITVDVGTVCNDINLSTTVVVHLPPNIDAGADTTIPVESSIQLNATGGVQYLWQPPEGLSCFACPDPIATPNVTTTYLVTVLDANGCQNSDAVTVYVEYLPLFLPTAFSPNGDGVNDVLYLRGSGIASMNLILYDRNGKIIFQSNNRDFGWDGMLDGQKASAGVYAFQCTVARTNGEVVEMKGNVTLVR